MPKRFLLALILLALASFALADTKVANDPTRISVGARLLGMGKSYVGLADDISSIFLNPAGLTSIYNWQLTSMQGKFIGEVSYLNMATAAPTDWGNFGMAYVTSDLNFTSPASTIEVIDGVRIIPSTTEGVNYGYNNSVLLFSFGQKAQLLPVPYLNTVENLSLGATFKLFAQVLSGPGVLGGTARGYDMDVSLKYVPLEYLSLGATVQNVIPYSLGGKIHWEGGGDETLPSVIKLGSSFRLLGENGFNDVAGQELAVNLDYDLTPLRPNIPNLMHLGMEWSPLATMSLRLGIDQDVVGTGGATLNVANNLTCGLGLNYRGFRFDYAFHQYYAIPDNDTHYFSLSFGMFNKPPPPPVKWLISPPAVYIAYDNLQAVTGEVKDREIVEVVINNQKPKIIDNYFEYQAPLTVGKNTVMIEGYDKRERLVMSQKLKILRLPSFNDVGPENWARRPIGELAYLNILSGYPDNTFQPDKTVTRAEFAALLFKASATSQPQLEEQMFTDVPLDHWAANYIYAATLINAVKGYPDNTFNPQGSISRAEGVAAIARFARLDLSQPLRENPYSDIPGRHWAAKEINAAKNSGYLYYLDNFPFEPSRALTRGEVAEILSRTPQVRSKLVDVLDYNKGY